MDHSTLIFAGISKKNTVNLYLDKITKDHFARFAEKFKDETQEILLRLDKRANKVSISECLRQSTKLLLQSPSPAWFKQLLYQC